MAALTPYIRRALRLAPVIIERLVRKLPPEAIDARPDPARFTIREVICHLADWEPLFLERLRGCVTEPNFVLVTHDEGQLAIEHDYAHQDLEASLARYKAGRDAYATYVETLSNQDLDKVATHPELGVMTATGLIELVVGHDVYHIEQISAFL